MATPRTPIVRGQYPNPYRDFIDQKKIVHYSSNPRNLERSDSSEDENYGENEYVVEKIISHKRRRDGRYRYFLKWKDYPDTENSWENEEDIYAIDLLEAYWRNKSVANSKTFSNGNSNGHQVKKRRASSKNKKSSYQPNRISSRVINPLPKSTNSANDRSLVKYRNEDASRSNSFKSNGKNEESSQSSQLKVLNESNPSSSAKVNNKNAFSGVINRITRGVYNDTKVVNDQASTVNVTIVNEDEEDSSSESLSSGSESSSSSDDQDTMEIDEEEANDDEQPFAQQKGQKEKEEEERDTNEASELEPPKPKLGPKKPKSNNHIRGMESLYDDRGVKSIVRNIDENWDPYVKEVVAIEPHDKYPNVLWVYISWRGGFTSVHLSTEANKLCPQSIIKFYEKRIIHKGSFNYENE